MLSNINYLAKRVEIGNIQYTIPGYFQEPDDEEGDMLVYAFETSKDQGGFIDFIYRNMYDDDGETATAIASHQALLQTNQTQVDAAVDRMLFDAIEAGLDNINGQDEAFVKEMQIACFPGKEFRFTVNQDGMDLNGLLVASFDINTGDVYCVVMCETVDSTENKLADFDKIIESAKLMGGSAETSVISFGGGEKNGADPSKKTVLSSTTGVDPELKAALDEYESFMNDYCDFMKKYAENPANAISMLSDYTEMLNRYTEFASKIDNLDTSNMSTADYEYYLDVLNRVEKKLLQVTQ
ncbi:MAG: hypothetical protein IJ058_03965 [Lachnospiraceae bacterium]|nr:hypothetical protein [Lachnospiraceae bacterium]